MSNAYSIVRSPDGYLWHAVSDDDHLALGGHETALEPVLVGMADPNKAFLNVGSHVGLWAIRLAKHVSRVYAIEANPKTARKLDLNVKLNGLDDKVLIYNMAAWNKDDQRLVLVDENDMATGGSTRVEPLPSNPGPRGREKAYRADELAQTSRLDSLKLDPIGLISLDVEGAEAKVLEGAEGLIMRDRPNMEIELHVGHPGTDFDLREQVYYWLNKFNYTYSSVDITGERLLCFPAEKELEEMAPSPSLHDAADDGSIDLHNFLRGKK